ncbi:hypothetical protein SAMN05216174_11727 [Actinokineospora iranica]|uniref:Uncharacterized protein n=1 Tax=Actinokineospora iranica TaxID=1271860 RepID=A0A1G6XCH0_9PSEU|nr:hypothetical protein SAMN05216174_11727 [Actinokineospora iranica]
MDEGREVIGDEKGLGEDGDERRGRECPGPSAVSSVYLVLSRLSRLSGHGLGSRPALS